MSWLVVREPKEQSLFSHLDADRDPNMGELAFCCTLDSNDLLHVFEAAERDWLFGFDPSKRKQISKNREVWFCVLEEHTMISECCFWRNGVEIWGVTHDSECRVFHLEERGELPEVYQQLKKRRLTEQQDEEQRNSGIDVIISLPMDLCCHFTSYDGDVDGPSGEYFELFSGSKPAQPKVGFLLTIFMNIMALTSRIGDRIRGGRRKTKAIKPS